MKPLLIILGLVILYLALELGVFWYRVNHLPNLQPAGQAPQSLGSGPLLRYVAAGDSTAVGIGATNIEATYAYQVAQFLAKTNTVQYQNIGVVGAKTSDVLKYQVQQIIDAKPDVVTISIGANDATHLEPSTKILNNYKAIIQELEAQTSAKIYITDIANFNGAHILPWFYINLIEWRSKNENRGILSLADARTKIVDIHNFGWSTPPYNDRSKTYAADNFHPNNLGYQNWTDAFLSQIK